MLLDAGYGGDRVAVLAGGIRAWHEAGYPMVRWNDLT
jgi:rhodanese-related sulfurtransferase